MKALSQDASSHGFWESIGWIRRNHSAMYGGMLTERNSGYFDEPLPPSDAVR